MNEKICKLMTYVLIVFMPIVFLTVSIMIGPFDIGPFDVMRIITGKLTGEYGNIEPIAVSMIWKVRMPRIIGAVLVGAALSIAGAVFQGIFRNPLASPYTLGISGGAGFGAALAILLSTSATASMISINTSALIFALLAVVTTFVAASRGRRSTVTLVLAGMLVGSLFSSLIALIKYVADPYEKLPQIVYWLMGSLSSITYEKILMILPLYIVATAYLFLMSFRINVMCMGDREAKSFGIDVKKARFAVITACSVITALVVSLAGIIGWVGIVVPHLARIITGPDIRKLLPVSASLGACYLLAIDLVCRNLTSAEIPVGVLTGILGTPIFIYFIARGKVRWE